MGLGAMKLAPFLFVDFKVKILLYLNMERIITTAIGVYIALAVFYCSTQNKPSPPPVKVEQSPKPDPTRKVSHFDWEKYEYSYVDSFENFSYKEKDVELYFTHRVKPKNSITYYPDFTVEIVGQGYEGYEGYDGKDVTYIVKGNQRYRVYEKANGDIELIPSR